VEWEKTEKQRIVETSTEAKKQLSENVTVAGACTALIAARQIYYFANACLRHELSLLTNAKDVEAYLLDSMNGAAQKPFKPEEVLEKLETIVIPYFVEQQAKNLDGEFTRVKMLDGIPTDIDGTLRGNLLVAGLSADVDVVLNKLIKSCKQQQATTRCNILELVCHDLVPAKARINGRHRIVGASLWHAAADSRKLWNSFLQKQTGYFVAQKIDVIVVRDFTKLLSPERITQPDNVPKLFMQVRQTDSVISKVLENYGAQIIYGLPTAHGRAMATLGSKFLEVGSGWFLESSPDFVAIYHMVTTGLLTELPRQEHKHELENV
jgi:hypothetical protein